MKRNKLIVIGNDNGILRVAKISINNLYDVQLIDELSLDSGDYVTIHSCLISNEYILILDSHNSVLYKYNLSSNEYFECYTGKDPRHLCKSNDYLYITNFDSDSISIVDYEGFFLSGTITVGMKPHDILEYGNRLYITCYEENCVIEYELNTNSIRYIYLSGKPMHIKRYENYLYVLLYSINRETKTTINQINLDTYENIELFVINEITNNFIIDYELCRLLILSIETDTLYIYDIQKREKIKQIQFNGYLEDVSADGEYLYIANSDKKTISVMDKLTFEQKHHICLDFVPICIVIENNEEVVSHSD